MRLIFFTFYKLIARLLYYILPLSQKRHTVKGFVKLMLAHYLALYFCGLDIVFGEPCAQSHRGTCLLLVQTPPCGSSAGHTFCTCHFKPILYDIIVQSLSRVIVWFSVYSQSFFEQSLPLQILVHLPPLLLLLHHGLPLLHAHLTELPF